MKCRVRLKAQMFEAEDKADQADENNANNIGACKVISKE